MRQGCSLSPGMFNLLVVDLEEEMRKDGDGGGVNLYILTYADGVVMIAEKGSRSMMARLEEYLNRRGLVLNERK